MQTCRTCCRPINSPFRSMDEKGNIVHGCISMDHDGAILIGKHAAWHNRKEAKAYRRMEAKKYVKLPNA